MKLKILLAVIILLSAIGFAHAEPYTPTNGTFAFHEVEKYEINGINFTIPTEYNITIDDADTMEFENNHNKIKITVTDNGQVKKVKTDKSKNITSSKSMLGAVKGYLVDKNGTYTFSYKEDGKLVTLKSKNMPLMIGVMENE